ncbi:ABC transporter ATP-binding protein [Tepidibacter formicigenes]|jgi:ABC-2 type transport system ATP-binding protein|uniref:ABC-2 type transport system ATP-binding protein n=1 Tax=Tepidibacter formicigenes DSM 15518 TaxID=1123349 RepID=A0A1M6N9X5_9FIRM|nr:ABC transporter ATP-binding protein [Tepidibacter formicigenes]SHJ92437.1 ABC-2 type transport system ATP-binding protein [Tepidibacter formicigenes DSM 15518]
MVIETYNLTKKFNGKGGFENISLSVKEGEVFSFLGKNGAGKSTFIRTLLGILYPTSGGGVILKKPLGDVNTRKKIGYLPELFQYHNWLTGYELLFNHGLLYKMNKKDIKRRIEEVLDIVGLKGHEHKKIKEYSKGMKQRIGLGCAILSDPELLFLDEPTSALDPVGRKQVRDIIFKLKKEGKTIFLNTHLLSEVELVSDRVAILDKGIMKKVGTMKELMNSPVVLSIGNLNEEIINKLKVFDPTLKKVENEIEMSVYNDDTLPKIAECIVKNNGLLYMMKRKENVLEELFIKTVGEEDSR